MRTATKKLRIIEDTLSRYAERHGCSQHSLMAANFVATVRCYKGERCKDSILIGKKVLEQLKHLENP